MKKRSLILTTAAVLALTLCMGCGGKTDTQDDALNTEIVETDLSTETETVEDESTETDETGTAKTVDGTEDAENQTPAQDAGQEDAEENETTETQAPAYTYTDKNQTMYAKSAVNVRSLPSTDGEKLGGLSKAQEITVTGQCNETGWYRIDFNGQAGYVSSSYLVNEKPAAETPSAPQTPATPSNPSAPEASAPEAPAAPSLSSQVYGANEVGDGVDAYRAGLHKYSSDGTQLYVLTTWNGMKGYYETSKDSTGPQGIFGVYFDTTIMPDYGYCYSAYQYDDSEGNLITFVGYYNMDESGNWIY